MGPHIVRIWIVLLLRDAEDEVCDNKQLQPCRWGATCGGAVVVRARREGAWRRGAVLGTMVRIPGERLRGQLCRDAAARGPRTATNICIFSFW